MTLVSSPPRAVTEYLNLNVTVNKGLRKKLACYVVLATGIKVI